MSVLNHTPEPWAFKAGSKTHREMSTITKANDPTFIIGYAICEATNVAQRDEDLSNATIMTAAPTLFKHLREIISAHEDRDTEELNKACRAATPLVKLLLYGKAADR